MDAAQAKYVAKSLVEMKFFSRAISNADVWSGYALVSYVQGRLGHYPHRPVVPMNLTSMKRKNEMEEREVGPLLNDIDLSELTKLADFEFS